VAVENVAQAQAIGQYLAELLRDRPTVQRLWYTMPHSDSVAFWLLTEPIAFDAERDLYEFDLMLHDRFPDAYARLHVLNPCNYADGDAQGSVPTYAEEIPVRRA
jgi:hypothetical protein